MGASTQHSGRLTPLQRRVAGAAPVVALAVLLLGSYRGGWSWTGFRANGTLWDWLHLLLLPVAVATLPLWFDALRGGRRWWARWWLLTLLCLLLALLVVIVGGYGFSWAWTGFRGNTLWDWLDLLLVPAILPLAVFWLTHRTPEPEREATPEGATK